MSTAIPLISFNPLLLSTIDEFEDRFAKLRDSNGATHYSTALALCELSRSIRFRLGPPDTADDRTVDRIVKVFKEAAQAICSTAMPGNEERRLLQAFKDNITLLADEISRERSAARAALNGRK